MGPLPLPRSARRLAASAVVGASLALGPAAALASTAPPQQSATAASVLAANGSGDNGQPAGHVTGRKVK